jgi:hypothetical protein
MIIDRLLNNVAQDPETGCWEWLGGKHPNGYGLVYGRKKTYRAHRISYLWFKGDILADGLDHLCRNRPCINPDHLEPVSVRVNVLRGEGITAVAARKTHCPQGHEYGAPRQDGKRYCRPCQAAWARRHRASEKELNRDR